MSDLAELFSPTVVEAIERLVDERVNAALARERENGKRWLTVGETGAYLGCKPAAVYARIRRGRIPGHAVRHVGRSVLIDRQGLDRELERGT